MHWDRRESVSSYSIPIIMSKRTQEQEHHHPLSLALALAYSTYLGLNVKEQWRWSGPAMRPDDKTVQAYQIKSGLCTLTRNT